VTAEEFFAQWTEGFAQEEPHLPDAAQERAVAVTAEEFFAQWTEGFAQEEPHLPDAAQERAVAVTAEEFLAQWTEGFAQEAPRPPFRSRVVTFARLRDLISARNRNQFLQPRIVPFSRRYVLGLREPMRSLVPISEQSHSPLTHDHTGQRPSAHLLGHGTETSGPQGLVELPRRNLQWHALGLLNFDRLGRDYEIGRHEELGLS